MKVRKERCWIPVLLLHLTLLFPLAPVQCDRCHDLNAGGDGPAMLSSIIRNGIRGTAMPPRPPPGSYA